MSEPVRRVTLETLIEQQRLHDLLVQRWCLGVDTVDWRLYKSVLSNEVEMDFPNPWSATASLPTVWKSSDWIEFVRQIEGFDATQHYISNFIYDINGNAAVVKTYLAAEHHMGNEYFTLGGRSTHTFKRTPDGWRVVKAALRPWWTKGNPALLAKAAERYAAKQAPRSQKAIV
ncbi:MAG TPA: nuclear transport factor 2 family protein [Steroidobacteraceae bacterium]|jgi:hypothetical protein|nr:nuclear transport factor 2 family protein [Steroidobacteraceae bacterium]